MLPGVDRPIPTLTDVHHIGFTVPDLEQAIEFFVAVLGFSLISRHGPLADDELEHQFDVPPGSSVRWAFLRRGSSLIELGEWTTGESRTQAPRNSDLGGRHLALGVTDLEAAIERLKTVPDVQLLKPRGQGFVYFETPFGLFVQLIAVQA
jgi:catechol 2,3-dioxygenase-like lactoylglutathione lyase family enzyme